MPLILGTISDQQITDLASVDPFASAMIVDPLLTETQTLTITLSNALDGVLTNLAGGTYNALTGVYTLSGSLTAVNSALQGLVFRPTAHQAVAGVPVTTVFTVADTDTSSLLPATDVLTSVVATATAAPTAIDPSPIVPFYGVNYGPFQGAESPGGGYPTAAQIAADIPTLSGMANAIRLYTVSNGIGSAVADAAADGLQVVPSANLVNPTGVGGAAANDDEINNLVTLLNNPSTNLNDIPFVVIGDDFLKANPTQYNYLISEIQYVRAHVPSSVKITTAETWDDYLTNFPSLGNQVDLVFADVDPFQQSTPVSLANAPGFVAGEYDALEEHYTGKNVVLGGTGWPSAGTNGSDVGSIANEQTFWTQFDALAKLDNISFFGPEAFDEPYRTGGGIYGPNSGLYNANRTAKGALTTLVPSGGGQTFTLSAQPGNSLSLYNTGAAWDFVSGSSGSVFLSNAQTSLSGAGNRVTFVVGAGNAASLYSTSGNWDTVSGSNGTVLLTSAQASVFGGDDTIDYSSGTGNAVSLYNTGGVWDTINGASGTAYLTSAQANVSGGGDSISFVGGSGNAVSLYNTAGKYDSLSGSGGTLYLTNAQTSVFGGGDAISFAGGTGNVASLYSTSGDADAVTGSGATIYLTSAQASVTGGSDGIELSSGSGNSVSLSSTAGNWDVVQGSNSTVNLANAQTSVFGANDTINLTGGSGNAASLYQTSGGWDAVNGSSGLIYLTSSQASVFGGSDAIVFAGGTGNAASLYQTSGNWDFVNGSNGVIDLTSSQTSVLGGLDTINFSSGASNAASLYQTSGKSDVVNGSGGSVYLTSAQASVFGGLDSVVFAGGSGNSASLYQTNGNWDGVAGSDGTVLLNNAQASIFGGIDTVDFGGATGNAAALYNTGNAWDSVNGSNGVLYLVSAQTNVYGGSDTIYFSNDAGNVVSLAETGIAGDTVNGSDGEVDLYTATATVNGSGDTIDIFGSNLLTLDGASETAVFAPGVGGLDTINGFGSTDILQFSKSEFANFNALSSAISQSGANTLITLDPNDAITLVGVTASSLTAQRFSFV